MSLPAKKLKGPSFVDALKTTTKKEPKKKTTMPVLEVSAEVQAAVDQYVKAKETNKKSKAEMDDAGDTIITFARSAQDEDGYKHRFRHSYAIPGEDDSQVKFVSSNRFSINVDDADQIREILGSHYDDMIEDKFKVSLKDEVLENDDLQDELMELIGDRFADFFETKQALAVCEGFDGMIYSVVKEKDLPVLRTFVRQYKPSLR